MSLPLGHPPARRPSASAAAESWFLARGLPSVLTRRARWRGLWPRSAPAIASYTTLHSWTVPVFLITGGHDVNIDGEPTAAEWTLLVLIALAPPLIVGVGWLVSRLSNSGIRSVIAIIGVTWASVNSTRNRLPAFTTRKLTLATDI